MRWVFDIPFKSLKGEAENENFNYNYKIFEWLTVASCWDLMGDKSLCYKRECLGHNFRATL